MLHNSPVGLDNDGCIRPESWAWDQRLLPRSVIVETSNTEKGRQTKKVRKWATKKKTENGQTEANLCEDGPTHREKLVSG
jgi:hypothetical protein